MNQGISKKTKWSYCVGATGRDAAYVLVSMFILTYIQYTMKLTIGQFSVISAAMVVCMVWDAVNDLMMSAIIENCHFKSGKFRPFILVGALLNATVIVLMFTIRPTGWGFVGFFCVTYLLWGMTYTVNDIAYWGMLPSLSSDPKERDSLVTLMGIFVCIGQFAVAGVVPIVIAGNAVNAFRIIALIVALLFIAFQLLTYFGVTENQREDGGTRVSFKDMFKILARNDQLISVGIAYILFCVGQQLLLLLAVNFFYFEFGYSKAGDLITLFTVMYGLGTLAAQFVYPILSKRFSRIRILSGAIIALVTGYFLFLAFGYVIPMNVLILNITGFVIFFCQGLYNLAVIVMVNNTVEYDEYRFGERHDSIISAIRSFASKLSNALNQGAASLILIVSGIYAVSQDISGLEVEVGNGTLASSEALIKADGFIAEVQASQTFMLRLGMVLVPLVAMIAAFLIIKVKYKIDEKEYERIVGEIAARKGQ
ncbi:MAG: glycoside-pentoside-hexuronide (GPH):cation symporter [Lachnospiraceae bacterium]|nr:glycoside-pentoside-hexuronide (GPH):cation symporter [Lachnospiraceae bacterium]